jgi:hypothetical protein
MSFRAVRQAVGTIADFTAIGLFIPVAIGLWYWLGQHEVPAWALVISATIAAIAIALLVVLLVRGRLAAKQPSVARGQLEALREQLKQTEAEVAVLTNYISQADDFLSGIRLAFAETERKEALRRLERVRTLVFDAVIQGINSAREEHIRCAFFEPVEEGGQMWLRAKHHHGHTHEVEKLRLYPDHRSIAGAAFASGEAVYVEEAQSDPRVQRVPAGRQIGSLLCVPAFGYSLPRDRPVGVLQRRIQPAWRLQHGGSGIRVGLLEHPRPDRRDGSGHAGGQRGRSRRDTRFTPRGEGTARPEDGRVESLVRGAKRMSSEVVNLDMACA